MSHDAEQFSWVPLPRCSPPGCLLPIKSLAFQHVSLDNSFSTVRQEPALGALEGEAPPSYNNVILLKILRIGLDLQRTGLP